MHIHLVDNIQVRIHTGEQRRLSVKIPRGRGRDPIKHVRDVECVEIETAARDADRLMLPMERGERVGDVVEVNVCAA